jgi:hypothetical protein
MICFCETSNRCPITAQVNGVSVAIDVVSSTQAEAGTAVEVVSFGCFGRPAGCKKAKKAPKVCPNTGKPLV